MGKDSRGQVVWYKWRSPNPGTFTVISGYENRPVVYVSWYGAVAYCNWLSRQHGYTPCYGSINNRGDDPSVWRTLNGYRLPTEAEFEYACRAGSTTDYYWGENYNNTSGSPFKIDRYCWYLDNSHGNHYDIGTKLPNAWGLYDMIGNVAEWCGDWYDANYYNYSLTINPSGPMSGSMVVSRGADWHDMTSNCRSAFRIILPPDQRSNDLGFRLVRN